MSTIVMNILIQGFLWTYAFISLGYVSQIAGHMVTYYLIILKTAEYFPKQLHHFTSPLAMYTSFNFSTFLPTVDIAYVFD